MLRRHHESSLAPGADERRSSARLRGLSGDPTVPFPRRGPGRVDLSAAAGAVSNRRSFTSFEGRDGAPDGATVDAEGYVWSALVYGGKLLRFAPDGSLDREIDMPVKKVTSVMFGGPDLDVLYVTSMAKPPLPRPRPCTPQ